MIITVLQDDFYITKLSVAEMFRRVTGDFGRSVTRYCYFSVTECYNMTMAAVLQLTATGLLQSVSG